MIARKLQIETLLLYDLGFGVGIRWGYEPVQDDQSDFTQWLGVRGAGVRVATTARLFGEWVGATAGLLVPSLVERLQRECVKE